MRSARATAAIALAAVCTDCLPQFEYAEASSSSSSSSSGGIVPCSGSPVGPASDGPYGAAKIYFGTPEVEAVVEVEFLGRHGGAVSPDGLHFVRVWNANEVAEHVRSDVLGPWGAPSAPAPLFYELVPRLFRDNLRVVSCHGGEGKCLIHRRETVSAEFVAEHYFQDFPPFDGDAQDVSFTPSADGKLMAFTSTRKSPDDDSPEPGDGDLWTAVANDPDDPTQGYRDLVRHDVPSAAVWVDTPTWLSDDGLTLFFHSPRETDDDLYVTERASIDEPFGPATRLDTLSADISNERHLTMPSLETLSHTTCNAGWAYFHVELGLDPGKMWRVPVCAGAPCE